MQDVTAPHLAPTKGAVRLVHFYTNAANPRAADPAQSAAVEVVRALAADAAASKLFRVARFTCNAQPGVCEDVDAARHPLQVRLSMRRILRAHVAC